MNSVDTSHVDPPQTHIDRICSAAGLDDWGVAGNRPHLPLSPDLPRAISLLKRHDADAMRDVEGGPTEAFFQDYKRLNRLLNAASAQVAAALRAAGHDALALEATIEDDVADGFDWGAAGVFPHKSAATRAGLGWIGKTALLVSPRHGSAIRLATVFTDAPLEPATAIDEGRCAACRDCVDACPAGAGRDVTWHAGMPRDGLYEEKACELHTETYDDFDGVCSICAAVCPWTQRALEGPD